MFQRISRGSPTFSSRVQLFPCMCGGGAIASPIRTHITCVFPWERRPDRFFFMNISPQ